MRHDAFCRLAAVSGTRVPLDPLIGPWPFQLDGIPRFAQSDSSSDLYALASTEDVFYFAHQRAAFRLIVYAGSPLKLLQELALAPGELLWGVNLHLDKQIAL